MLFFYSETKVLQLNVEIAGYVYELKSILVKHNAICIVYSISTQNQKLCFLFYSRNTSVKALTRSVRFISRAVIKAHILFFHPVFNRVLVGVLVGSSPPW